MTQELVERLVKDAAVNGNVVLGERLIAEGADVNGRQAGQGSYTALITAAFNGQRSFVEMLLLNGVDIGMKCSSGFTARDWAIKGDKKSIVDFLDSWKARFSKTSLAQQKDLVVIVTPMAARTLEETFNFAARERISVLCASPGAPAETMLRESFSDISDQSGIEKAFSLYKEYGGKLTEDDVFPDRIMKVRMPRLGGGG